MLNKLKALSIILLYFLSSVHGCIRPYYPEVFRSNVTTLWDIYNLPFELAEEQGVDGLLGYSVLKQVRVWHAVMSSVFSVMAYHDSKSLDFFSSDDGYINFLRRCQPIEEKDQIALDESELSSFAYTYLLGIKQYIPEWADIADAVAANITLDLNHCKGADPTTFGCGYDTDVGLSRGLFDAYVDVFEEDGWNADGQTGHAHNGMEYDSVTKAGFDHVSQCVIWTSMNNICENGEWDQDVCWKPSRIIVGGEIYKQEYQMPHVADQGRSFHLSDSIICNYKSNYPCYDLEKEAKATISRLKDLDDEKKVKVEYFENVFHWYHSLLKNALANTGKSNFETVKTIAVSTASLYEAILVNWNIKKEIGMIRPKSFINMKFAESTFKSYLGPNKGSGDILGKDWAPYVPDSPSAEFPSQIACLCSSFSSMMKSLSISDPNYGVTLPKHSSGIENNMPSSDINFTIKTWDEFETLCHESRLDSGNHFSRATSEAKAHCSGVSDHIFGNFDKITSGKNIWSSSSEPDGFRMLQPGNLLDGPLDLLFPPTVVPGASRCGQRLGASECGNTEANREDFFNGLSNYVVSLSISKRKTRRKLRGS